MSRSIKELASAANVTHSAITKHMKTRGLFERCGKDGKSWIIPDDVADEVLNHFNCSSIELGSSERENAEQEQELIELRATVASLTARIEETQRLIDSYQDQIKQLKESLNQANSQLQIEINRNAELMALLKEQTSSLTRLTNSTALTIAADKKEALLTDGTEKRKNVFIRIIEAIKS